MTDSTSPIDQRKNPITRSQELAHQFLHNFYLVSLDVLRRHSLMCATIALLGTYMVKIWWHSAVSARPGGLATPFLAFFADDLLLWAGAIFLVLFVEDHLKKTWATTVTTLITVVLAIVALGNVFWLRGTGDQLTLSVIEVGISRTAEVLPILKIGLGLMGVMLLLGSLGVIIAFPFLVKMKWRRLGFRGFRSWTTYLYPLLLVCLGIAGRVEQRGPVAPGWKIIAANVHYSLVEQYLDKPILSAAPTTLEDPSPAPASAVQHNPQPNILLVILEATAHRATSLNPTGHNTTPTLKQLADEGLEARSMRAVLPHTSKSLYSMLCGRYPAMQRKIIETSDNYASRCLPEILRDNGYATHFFQSADGRFEQRPRLAANMGFEDFTAWQDIVPRPKPLSYLASDDLQLVKPVSGWIQDQDKPFFATVLTSATHHAYELPAWLSSQTGVTNNAPEAQRYLALVSGEDLLVQELISRLPDPSNTIVMFMGDHGEAFGEHGAYQHDNIHTEGGLHVPFAIHWPGHIEPRKLDKPRSLIDVTPTLLDLAKVSYREELFDGRSLLGPDDSMVKRHFTCWYDNVCIGFVEGTEKFVYLPNSKTWLVYDLVNDSQEYSPGIEPSEWSESVSDIKEWQNTRRYNPSNLVWSERLLFGDRWLCKGGNGGCVSTFKTEPNPQ